MARFSHLAKRLQTAINNSQSGEKLLLYTRQWFSRDKNRVVTIYNVRLCTAPDDEQEKYKTIDLYSTYSQIQLVLWLRDYWYKLNQWEIPTDNKIWENIKGELVDYDAGDKTE